MPKRRKEEREEAYVIILFLFILGIGLLLGGYLVGIVAILLSLVITIAMFPAVGETISEIVKGLMSLIEGRKTKEFLVRLLKRLY